MAGESRPFVYVSSASLLLISCLAAPKVLKSLTVSCNTARSRYNEAATRWEKEMEQQQTPWLLYVGLIVGAFVLFKLFLYLSRRKYLIGKYGRDLGLKILSGAIWQGMTREELADFRGNPIDVDHTIYKTKTKETWKYNQTGKNRFKERIYLENGVVVGWKD